MKKQLITAIGLKHITHLHNCEMETLVVGIVYYFRTTKFLKRKVRKVIYKITESCTDRSVEQVKKHVRQILNDVAVSYYSSTDE